MKQICRYSGLVLQHSTLLDNMGLPPSRTTRLGEHPVFSYSLRDTLVLATFKPAESLTSDQRHLLACALLRHFGTIDIRYPLCKHEVLRPAEVLAAFPVLLEISTRIALHSKAWNSLLPELPRMEVRTDNRTEISPLEYCKNILLPNSTLLLFSARQSRTELREGELLEDELELERQLKATLAEHRAIREKYLFKPHMGKHVLDLLRKCGAEIPLLKSQEFHAKCTHLWTTKPEKLKVPSTFVRALRTCIVELLPTSLESEHSLDRAYTALTVGYLDAVLDYFTDLGSIFGAITTNKPAQLPANYPAQYTVRTVVPSPLDVAGGARIEVPRKKIAIKSSFVQNSLTGEAIPAPTSTFLEKLKARKAAAQIQNSESQV